MRHQYFSKNTKGKDYAVGDIHGNFPALQAKLVEIGFNEETDRLFTTGDMVDKGWFSRLAYAWTQYEWFHSTLGNHDMHVALHGTATKGKWLQNYGLWFSKLKPVFQQQMQEAFSKLPLAITVETDHGFVGIIHAFTPYDTWYETLSFIDSSFSRDKVNHFLYSRTNFNNRHNTKEIRDLSALLVGHCPVEHVERHSNTWYLDTDAYKTGNYEILDLQTMQII